MENTPNTFAFPTVKTTNMESIEAGMTLRDYFANSAMQSFAKVWYEDAKNNPDSIASKSYKLADAMLKAREL